jgi:Peptidase_C39 like family
LGRAIRSPEQESGRGVAVARLLPWLVLLAGLGLAGCAVQTRELLARPSADIARAVELTATPFFPQTELQCGPAALATALAALGLNATPEALTRQVFLPARAGTLQVEMLGGARRNGAVATRLPPTLAALLREVHAGTPVVVLLNLGLSWSPVWHYAVVVGYDLDAREVVLRSGRTRRELMALSTFEHTWMRAAGWAFVATLPGHWPVTATEAAAVEAGIGFERVAPPGQAVLAYRSALARWEGSLTLAMGLGNSLYASGDKVAAAEVFRAAATRHGSAPAWINLATTLLDLGAAAEALPAVQAAIATGDSAYLPQAQSLLQRARQASP